MLLTLQSLGVVLSSQSSYTTTGSPERSESNNVMHSLFWNSFLSSYMSDLWTGCVGLPANRGKEIAHSPFKRS